MRSEIYCSGFSAHVGAGANMLFYVILGTEGGHLPQVVQVLSEFVVTCKGERKRKGEHARAEVAQTDRRLWFIPWQCPAISCHKNLTPVGATSLTPDPLCWGILCTSGH